MSKLTQAKNIAVGDTIIADYKKDLRQHLQMPNKPEKLKVDNIIDDEITDGLIFCSNSDGSTFLVNPSQVLEII